MIHARRYSLLAILSFTAILSGTSGMPAWAKCAPERMVKIVFRDATPRAAGTFAAQPKTLYRLGSHYVRLEEVPDPSLKLHGLIVSNQRDSWLTNLADSTGRHIVDKAESFDVHFPILGTEDRTLVDLEYGCELEFMKSRSVSPVRVKVADIDLDQYEFVANQRTIRLLMNPEKGIPWAVGLVENGNPTYLVRYDEYLSGLEPNHELFTKPSGIVFTEGN